ncbi:hypothetical protein CSE16_09960 [Solibacillus sp. R5-41]|uniref:hypothetical protein n=1 Tax=Solibacillus sp. R5-41 TaxID=2048654 RepID=UPI000C127AE1|nr:hypothetical protein [Solibacillus sp. R5-41]ATP40346.1 hypothetical protein CSE16_09960 [Solibacillus sp. R5-41]
MRKKINVLSFVLSIVCLIFFLIAAYWKGFSNFVIEITGTDVLNIICFISWITLFFGIIGMTSIRDGKPLLRGVITILITVGLSGMLTIMMLLNQSTF